MATRYASRTEVRSNYSTPFKAKVAAEYLGGRSTGPQIAERYGINQTLVYKWGKQVSEAVADRRSVRE
jgi:transposase-like protein